MVRPYARELRRVARGHLVATERILEPPAGLPGLWVRLKRTLIGPPLATAQVIHERLPKRKALAVFASDALSSSAYAPEETIRALLLAGMAGLVYTMPITLAVIALLVIVVASYRQTIRAYPQGGGSYIVTKDNLGTYPALLAASGLQVSYILTVAVSVSAGIAAITSAMPAARPFAVELALLAVLFITLANLRGVRESANIFAAPTYAYIGIMLVLIGAGGVRLVTGGPGAAAEPASMPADPAASLSIFLILRAFAAGCSALTGTEAIADGVPAFQEPQANNARVTLTWMGAILGILVLGISFLSVSFGILPAESETLISRLGRFLFGGGPLYYAVQAATMLILILAANTAFADFPRLSYFLARDRFLPHQFYFRGDRLAYSAGIVVLGVAAGALIALFSADTHLLIPLYAVGVFIAFTMSQSSMVRRWATRREPGWRGSLIFNAVGAATTALVAVVLVVTRFEDGAWIVLVILPIFIAIMLGIQRHYDSVAAQLRLAPVPVTLPRARPQPVVVPIAALNQATLRTLSYARSISPNVTAVHVTDDLAEAEALRRQWEEYRCDVPLIILESPYRSLIEPLLTYIDAIDQQDPEAPVTVVLSEFVPRHWWEQILHNQSALRLKWALFFRPNTVVVDFPYHLRE
ncbi:MAG: APC family permease [Chloroflexi bacterium]|nr:APC family permease [Chloroflexota bacterium]